MTDTYRATIIGRDARCCQRCGGRCDWKAMSVHHRKLRSKGGADTPENRVLLCGTGTTGCHGWVHAHPRLSRDAGWLVSGWRDPAAAEMWSASQRAWVRLDGFGWYEIMSRDGPPEDALPCAG